MAEVERLVVGPLAANCYIVSSEGELAVIDPGAEPGRILSRVGELGGTLRLVINTHGHIDHVAGNEPLLTATGAELLIHAEDAAMLSEPDESLASYLGITVSALEPSRTLASGDVVKVGELELTVLHTPGHTPGGICLLGGEMAFTGDTLFLDSIGRTDFPGGSNRLMRESLLSLRARLAGETVLYPGHGESGSFARAMLVNPFLGSVWPLD
ncbi:MAG TPA: MBL fold metallo-hydrolase [candidate division WOR-3 bacterium]|uniref:MBL fold metallo-hydrolase n=1 Tax=candidate division WOR-3 bacterium TaxID=2052148 RepID=A0A7V0T5X1_UNCW3|nr:MBL fold metallo-hydrolase [candidate division WOR-3 bacterium]